MRIGDLLERRGGELHTIACGLTVADAIAMMAKADSSALIVLQGHKPVGIFSERDVIRCYLRHRGRAFSDIPIDDAMTNKLIAVQPGEEVSTGLSTMIQSNISHLPVIEGTRVLGMLTLRTLVRHQLGELADTIEHLQQYIDDLHDGGND
jgi:CBS domain-containing protein